MLCEYKSDKDNKMNEGGKGERYRIVFHRILSVMLEMICQDRTVDVEVPEQMPGRCCSKDGGIGRSLSALRRKKWPLIRTDMVSVQPKYIEETDYFVDRSITDRWGVCFWIDPTSQLSPANTLTTGKENFMKWIHKMMKAASAFLLAGVLGMAAPVSAAIQRTVGCNNSVTTTYGKARTSCGVNGGTYTVYARASSAYNFASCALLDQDGRQRLYASSYNTTEQNDSWNFGGILSSHSHPASFGQTMRALD